MAGMRAHRRRRAVRGSSAEAHPVHKAGDGRGQRDVFVDGHLVTQVFFADARRGIVDRYRKPLRLDKHRKRALSQRIRGVVRVLPQATHP